VQRMIDRSYEAMVHALSLFVCCACMCGNVGAAECMSESTMLERVISVVRSAGYRGPLQIVRDDTILGQRTDLECRRPAAYRAFPDISDLSRPDDERMEAMLAAKRYWIVGIDRVDGRTYKLAGFAETDTYALYVRLHHEIKADGDSLDALARQFMEWVMIGDNVQIDRERDAVSFVVSTIAKRCDWTVAGPEFEQWYRTGGRRLIATGIGRTGVERGRKQTEVKLLYGGASGHRSPEPEVRLDLVTVTIGETSTVELTGRSTIVRYPLSGAGCRDVAAMSDSRR